MITAIVGTHVVEIPTRELTPALAHEATTELAERGIRVVPAVDVFHVVHLWALAETSTAQEVAALTAFRAVTDCRLAWHKAAANA